MTPESIQLSQEIEALDEMIENATYALELMCRGDSTRCRYERFRPGGKINARI